MHLFCTKLIKEFAFTKENGRGRILYDDFKFSYRFKRVSFY